MERNYSKSKEKIQSPNNDFSQDMVWISAGTFTMGSNHHYSDESRGNKHWDRFLPSARSIRMIDSSSEKIGFRCVVREKMNSCCMNKNAGEENSVTW